MVRSQGIILQSTRVVDVYTRGVQVLSQKPEPHMAEQGHDASFH